MAETTKKVRFSKLAQMAAEERNRAIGSNPGLLSQLTPTEIALLFPDYFKRGTPDVGGFREAISRQTAEKQATWQKSVDERVGKQGGWLERMRQQYGSTPSGGNLKQNQDEAYKAARAQGLSDSAARILVANMSGESLKNPGDHHWDRSHMSQGIVQWDPDRAERIRSKFGAYPKDMSVADQTKAAIWEMKTYYGKSYSALTNENLSPQDRLHTVVSDYERPQDVEGSVYNRMGYFNGLKISDSDVKMGNTTTPGSGGSQTTPGATSGGQTTGGMSFQVKSGYIVPKDDNLYDPRNAQQCATLGKAFNPSIGRSSGWNVVDGQIKAGQVVATKQYNNGGADRVGAGYHTGVAMTAPNQKGDFLLLEQYNNSGGAKLRWVNQHSYPAGKTGETTSWGLISSNGKVHDEISPEALSYGQSLASPEQKQAIGTNSGAPGAGGESAPGVSGEVSQGPMGGATFGGGDQQTASLLQPMGMVQNLMGMAQGGPMGMMMGMMGGMGMQSATPLGLITTAMGFIMPLIGSLAGERLSGEGMGDGPRRGKHGRVSPMAKYADIIARAGTPPVYRENLGFASKPYESGNRGVETVSTGRMGKKADPGGISYGSHQLSSRTKGERKPTGGTMMEFLKSPEGKQFQSHFGSAFPGSSEFNAKYKSLTAKGTETRSTMERAQEAFLRRTHYEPARIVAEHLGYNMKDPRVQETIYSMAIQHRNNLPKYLEHPKAMATIGKSGAEQVAALFDVRAQKNRALAGPGRRFDPRQEKATMLALNVEKLRGDQQLAEAKATQMASAEPRATTGAVGPTPTTSGAGAGPTTQMARAPVSLLDRAKQVAGLSAPAAAREMSVATTPKTSTDLTPGSTISTAARGTTATVMNPAQPAASMTPTVVTGMPGALQAPGPAPDMSAVQMGQVRNDIAAVAAQQQSTPVMAQQTTMAEAPSKGFNPDLAMKQIGQPYNTPSFQRAVTRAFGSETPGEVGQNHFSYGNAR